jgi:Tfp pilus assembly protein PilN
MTLINLLPEDYIRRKRAQRSNRLCLALFVVVMAGVLAAAIVSQRCRANTQSVLDRVDGEYQKAAAMMTELGQLQAQKQTMLEKAKSTSTLLERVPRSYLLAVVTNSLPPKASLLEVNLYPKQVIAPAEPVKDAKFAAKSGQSAAPASRIIVEMDVSGLAETDVGVARFIANLARCPLAESVDLVYSQEKSIEVKNAKGDVVSKPLLRQFEVRMVLRNDVDVIDVIGKKLAQAPTVEQGQLGGRQ